MVDENVNVQGYAGERRMAGPDKGKYVPPGVYQKFLTFIAVQNTRVRMVRAMCLGQGKDRLKSLPVRRK